MKNILHIDASGRTKAQSDSKQLSLAIVKKLADQYSSHVSYRDISTGLPVLNDEMIDSYFTAPTDRTELQNQSIVKSDELVQELIDNDIIVIGTPIYNFAMPAVLKIWSDLVARAGVTFKYTEKGPVGLLENKTAYVAITSGGVALNSKADFLTPWIKQFLGFLGISDVTIIDASTIQRDRDEVIANAYAQVQQL